MLHYRQIAHAQIKYNMKKLAILYISIFKIINIINVLFLIIFSIIYFLVHTLRWLNEANYSQENNIILKFLTFSYSFSLLLLIVFIFYSTIKREFLYRKLLFFILVSLIFFLSAIFHFLADISYIEILNESHNENWKYFNVVTYWIIREIPIFLSFLYYNKYMKFNEKIVKII
jgi:hypothetical protein